MRDKKIIENILKDLSSKIGDNILSNPNIMSNDPVEGLKDIKANADKLEQSEEVEEKWSEKYKKSINCNNPKGFSQRAHCQGRKKRLKESEEKDEKQIGRAHV